MAAARPMDVRAPPVVVAVCAMATCKKGKTRWREVMWRGWAKEGRDQPVPDTVTSGLAVGGCGGAGLSFGEAPIPRNVYETKVHIQYDILIPFWI